MSRKKINGNKVTKLMANNPQTCKHHGFSVDAVVHRITETKGGPVVGRCLCLSLACDLCGQQFAFKGLPVDRTHTEPSMTETGLEARLPIQISMGEKVGKEIPGQEDTVKFTIQKDE